MKSPRLYINALKRLKRSRGFGIHSPFAFDFVTNTLGGRLPYYCWPDLEHMRSVAIELAAQQPGRHRGVMSFKNMRMLFRVVCRFKPRHFFQIGATYGLSSATVLKADSRSNLYLYAPANPYAEILSSITEDCASRIIPINNLRPGLEHYLEQTRNDVCNADMASRFFIVNNLDAADETHAQALIAEAVDEGNCIVAVRNLSHHKCGTKTLWEALCRDMQHGMSFTNGETGFIAAMRHLPRQQFTLWF